jgi:hypothetical protein
MEDQVLPSQVPVSRPLEQNVTPEQLAGIQALAQERAARPIEQGITPEQLAEMKALARERAIQQTITQRAIAPQPPQVIYVRRNFTVAELLLVILLSCGIVTGIQVSWNFVSNLLPRIEVKLR